ncbi:MAG: cytosolic protein [Paenibacillus sp. RIFOXYA1_FULL_44_5]|nr:MAG: cytosolic protein [Paenibacillus sp. RIFOXYA1_FULL_44_5]
MDFDYLYDEQEQTTTRFVSFIGKQLHRYDLAITTTNHFYGKHLVTDIQSGKTAIIGADDLEEDGYLSYTYKISEEEAEELKMFLVEVVGIVNFTD